MILTKQVKVKIKGNNKLSYYKNLGYNTSSDFFVNINHLSKNSKILINAKCDFCGEIKEISYLNYNRNIKRSNLFSCSKKCSINKTRSTNIEKYGGTTPISSEKIKNKVKKTNLSRYGKESVFSSSEIKEKIKKTNLERYNSENPFSSKEIKEKIKKTNLEKYGVSFFTSSDFFTENKELIKEKIRNTNLEKYGDSSATKNEKYRKINTKIANNPFYVNYLGDNFSIFRCDMNNDHLFKIKSDNYISRHNSNLPLCTVCNPISSLNSIKEGNLYNFIKSIYDGDIIRSYRETLEIDIYLPDLNLGFEFNGLYWHSDKYKSKTYHLDKTNYFKEKGIKIIHIWEDDWDNKSDILKSQIKNWIGITDRRIYARKCIIKEVSSDESLSFLENNHIQGKVPSSLKIGLYFENELVSLMTFDHNNGRIKKSINFWNLNRFCNKKDTSVIGGFSKILNYFKKKYKPFEIITYADRDWSDGDLYIKSGFNLDSIIKPDYKYIVDNKRQHKSNFTKSRLGIKNEKITEREYTKMKGIDRIYDCGKIKFKI